jgi:uncharacterized protein
VFDELHKMEDWKNYIKGVFDTKPEKQSILVTGSARLEAYRQTGDSLAGRFFQHRIFPFTPSECRLCGCDESIDKYLHRGGFPEPFLADNDEFALRWRSQYADALIREDVFTIDTVQNLRTISILLQLLKERVGSSISYQSLSEDLECSPNTVKKYIEILKSLFIIFSVTPYSNNIARSLKKEPKVYFFDNGMVADDPGKRSENCTAVALYKYASAEHDRKGSNVSLHYLRTKEGREVDFVIARNGNPEYMVEVKYSKSDLPPSLKYFNSRYGIPGKLVVFHLGNESNRDGIEILRASSFLGSLL